MCNIIKRKMDTTTTMMLLQLQKTNTKPIVFSQTGSQLMTLRTSNTTGGALQAHNVRRSSRLFSNNNYSVKENTKSPQLNYKFVASRSPPLKPNIRICKNLNSSTASLLENVHERKSSTGSDGKEKIETITSSETLSEKVFINNSVNSAQKMAQHGLAMKKTERRWLDDTAAGTRPELSSVTELRVRKGYRTLQ
ncbi:uncharacterized protein LOC129754390 [Uranotaenia lowii]|uniref:uncharacterized protein LOC129754390 n=1 Tax=Uranotaenia lowii TaxID=190385 RepID=UPI00247ACA7B|nr:uncharacterized protein LOC129754390 [Uranotaenia lowii]